MKKIVQLLRLAWLNSKLIGALKLYVGAWFEEKARLSDKGESQPLLWGKLSTVECLQADFGATVRK